ncbi:MAG: AhpC/TSA family protein [Acidimicrobiia bacterium]|nr:AhpC/TSA family protein [Acidimicrobiia bacterium]
MSLREALEARRARGKQSFDAERSAVYGAQADALAASDILETALRTDDRAPDFTLPDHRGNAVSFSGLLVDGPVVLSFYRGSWCPFCNLELRALQAALADAEAAGVTLVALSPNTPDTSLELVNVAELTFPVLSDVGSEVAAAFNLVYEMAPEQEAYYRKINRDVGAMNGSERWLLPVPATYVIDRERTIRYHFVDLNHRVRAEPSEVIEVAARFV